MQKLKELENFYNLKIQKHDLEAAINSINSETKSEFETFLRERLTLKDYVFTFLSNVSTYDEFLFLWKSFFRTARRRRDSFSRISSDKRQVRKERTGRHGNSALSLRQAKINMRHVKILGAIVWKR